MLLHIICANTEDLPHAGKPGQARVDEAGRVVHQSFPASLIEIAVFMVV